MRRSSKIYRPLISVSVCIMMFSACANDKNETKSNEVVFGDRVSTKEVRQYFDTIVEANQFVFHPSDKLVLSPCDSLLSENVSKAPYYFEVFTKWLVGTDGYAAEAAGVAALKYLETQPKNFAKFLSEWKDTTVNANTEWEEAISGELVIAHDDNAIVFLANLNQRLLAQYETEEEKNFVQNFIKNLIEVQSVY